MTYNGKHPAQLELELDAVLGALAKKAKLPAFCADVDVSGSRTSLAYRDAGRRVSGEERPVFLSGCLLDIFLAFACLHLHEKEGLDLDLPFDVVLPELAPRFPDRAPITVRHLLTRTSGLQDPRSVKEMRSPTPWTAIAPRVPETRRLFSPGRAFSYGGIDSALLVAVLERFANESLNRVVRRAIVDPCNLPIREIQYGPDEADGFRPIAKFDSATMLDIVAHAGGGDGAAPGPFSAALRKQLSREAVGLSRSLRVQPWPHAPVGFTLGLFRFSDGLVGFNGWDRNQSCAIRFDPEHRMSFVVALEGPPAVRDAVIAEIAQSLGYSSGASSSAPFTVGGLNGLRAEEICGRYAGWADGYEAHVAFAQGIVSCDVSYRGEKFQRIEARLEEDAWLVSESIARAAALEFFRDQGTGRVCFTAGLLPYAMADLAAQSARVH